MSLLSTLGVSLIVARLAVVLPIEGGNLLFTLVDAQCGEIDRIGTHIGDETVFIQMLCHHHGLRNGKAEFA